MNGKVCVAPRARHRQSLGEYTLPLLAGEKEPPEWAFLTVADEYLIGGGNARKAKAVSGFPAHVARKVLSSSQRLTVLDRHTGKVLWSVTAESGFRHNAICLGKGTTLTPSTGRPPTSQLLAAPRRRRTRRPAACRPRPGDGQDEVAGNGDVFGTWLSYSAKHDVLVEAGRMARDTLFDEPKGMRAYRARTGRSSGTSRSTSARR